MGCFGTYLTHAQSCDVTRVQIKCYAVDCLAAYFTHAQSCDVTRVQSATQWTASVQTSHQDVMQYRGRLFTGCHVTSGRHMQELPWTRSVTSRHVTSRRVTSRHVTSGRHRRRGGRHVTSRHVRTSQAPPWTRMPSRQVTSRQEMRRRRDVASGRQAPLCTRGPSRHVTSRHVTTSGAPRADHALNPPPI